MKLKTLAAVSLGVMCLQANAAAPANSTFKSDTDRISYTIGADMGTNFRKNDVKVNPKLVAQGLEEALKGSQLKLTRQQMDQTLIQFQKKLEQNHLKKLKSESVSNKSSGESFLTENKSKPGVVTLADGLQYKIVEPGKGNKPKASDVVTVNYEGRFVNGNVFDSSYKRGKPATFPLSQVIKGWQQALQLMKTGATWEIYVPPHLAYGEQGIGGVIGPNQTLIFKVNLLSIKKKA